MQSLITALEWQITFVQPSNGQITAPATIGPTPLPSTSIYPNPNWNVAILTIIYFNVILHVQQGGIDILTFNFGTVDPVIAIQSILVL
ncbi:MAG: hypothetical protein WBL68_13070 [Nitrososphaeraceae archaeon]